MTCQAGVDQVGLGQAGDPAAEGSSPGGQAVHEEDGFEKGEVVTGYGRLQVGLFGGLPDVEHLARLGGQYPQQPGQRVALPHLADLQHIAADHQGDVVPEPAGASGGGASHRQWVPSCQHPTLIALSCLRAPGSIDEGSGVVQQVFAEAFVLSCQFALRQRPHVDHVDASGE
jgi:hypothetical protein